MNGRMYDPVIGRILSPDPYVSSPTNTQSYNRYSYCRNNPLRYIDPSGYFDVPIYNWSCQNYDNGDEKGGGDAWGFSLYSGIAMSVGLAGNRGGNVSFWGQLENSVRSLPDGYYDLSGIDVRNGNFTFSYKYNSAGTEYYNQMAGEANKQKAYNDKMTLAAAGNIGYGKSLPDPTFWLNFWWLSGGDEFCREIWYSKPIRNLVPDLLTLSIDFGATPGYGLSMTFQLNLLTRGDEPGFFFTNTPSTRILFEGDVSLNLGWGYYQYNPSDIKRESVRGKSYDISGGYIIGANLWFGGNDLMNPTWVGFKSGLGMTLGLSIGSGYTEFGLRPSIIK